MSKNLLENAGERYRIFGLFRRAATDALDLALRAIPKGSALARYRYGKDHIIPLLLRLEDEGERVAAAEDAAKALNLKLGEFKRLLRAESATREEEPEAKSDMPQLGSERYEQAFTLLNDPDLLGRAAADMEKLGHVGECKSKQLALICGVSARAGYPIQPSTHAQSSSGKNALWDMVLSFLPPEMVVTRSALSSKALYRTEANLKGCVLYIQEVAGSEDAEYTIRVMQSGGGLQYEATEKMPDGSMRNVVHKVEGPTVIIQTTTREHLHYENETRVFPIYIDESQEQTKRIVESILRDAAGYGIASGEREVLLQRWRDAVRLLEPSEVVIPFASRIEMPNSLVRIRRDARRVIDVVRVVAWLQQHRRERDPAGRILAAEADFHKALELIGESLSRAWRRLTPSEQKVLEAIAALPSDIQRQGFRRADLQVAGTSDSRLKELLKSLTNNGYLDSDFRKGRKAIPTQLQGHLKRWS